LGRAPPSLAALANPRAQIERVLATRMQLCPACRARRSKSSIQAQSTHAAAGAVHQGLAVRANPIEPTPLGSAATPLDGRAVLVLDGVTDPQNVGAVFRSAAAFGARAL